MSRGFCSVLFPFCFLEALTRRSRLLISSKNSASDLRLCFVPPMGFEPTISALRGRCPRPLDDGGRSGNINRHRRAASAPASIRISHPERQTMPFQRQRRRAC